MREILFRGKWLGNGSWVEGAFCPKNCDSIFGQMVYRPSIIKLDEPDDGYWFDIDPDTVGQYTGLKDKNGKRIFEGDVVKGLFLHERPVAGVVAFHEGAFGVKWMRGNVDEFNAFTSCCNVKWEVIGNVSDNPELLEGGVNDG